MTLSSMLKGHVEDVEEPAEDKTKETTAATSSKKGGGSENCCSCSLAMDIISTSLLYVMSLFFIVGGFTTHPRTYEDPEQLKEPYVFYFLGVVCYLTVAILDVVKRRSMGVLEISMTSIAILGGTLWVVSSILLFSKIFKFRSACYLWILGSICNLASITYDIVMIFVRSSGPKPFFRAVALKLSWLSNLLFIIGFVNIVKEYTTMTYCELAGGVNILAAGGFIYLFHSVFHTLSIFCKGVKFEISRYREE